MRFMVVITMVLLLVSACGETVQKGAVNFSGEWTLNADKSDLGGPGFRGRDRGTEPGQMPPPDRSKEPGIDQGREPGSDRGERPREWRRGGMGMGGTKLIVEQKENELLVKRLMPNPEGEEFSIKSTYTLDGKKCKNDTDFGTRVSTAKWSKDGKMLTIESTMTMYRGDEEFTMESTEKWSMDDNMLTIETTRSTPMGERTSKAVYDKVEK